MIYKILDSIPNEALKDGSVDPKATLPLSPLDANDGFIHLSTAAQLPGTLNKYFINVDQVILLHIDVDDDEFAVIEHGKTGNKPSGRIQWDPVPSRNDKFAHIYGDLLNEDVVKIQILKKEGDLWSFP
ncbi:hypothetical protein NADFUDRAFT_50902 [Nadsonia fulvescens var. elongata DSM 6958]|uniref:DUF952-domain-containing protein n=1 Tax=Nadsonia fulvescens var. elongata DSM 6958 TaxID=857566 RepID=A0A1E3PLA6_9ASCO|nr:hypothetical protein NADFUDRAFT_50902 [Nadsonia fulvescens var. elongata DSM 6958]